MNIETERAIKLFFPRPSLVLVYLEAIANSLDAGASEIYINIDIESFDKPETLKVTIKDDGEGFINENFDRFRILLKPRDLLHKGTGRLIFLNYFDKVKVNSKWDNKERTFDFVKDFNEEVPVLENGENKKNETTLEFIDFSREKVNAYNDLKPRALKSLILEHFLPTFIKLQHQNRDFKITINLNTIESNDQKEFFPDEITISSSDLPTMTMIKIRDNTIHAFEEIKMFYSITESTSEGNHLVAFNIDGRTIPVNLISKQSFPIGFSCVFLFESSLFESSSDNSRQKLILPDDISEVYLFQTLRNEIGKVVSENIPEITEKNEKIKKDFEEKFPHLNGYFDKETVGLIDSEDSLMIAQQRFFKAQKEILQCEKISDAVYEKSIEISSRTLTEYILYREKIIAKMEEITSENSEVEIHNLFVPRFKEYHENDVSSDVYQNNAWLLDDKFMSFRTILSEARMDRLINEIRLDEEKFDDLGRPDIAMIFSADPDDTDPVDVVVVEIKKKQDEEKENLYAISQLLKRARMLINSCKNIQRIWYYAVISVNDELTESLLQQRWTPLFSHGKVYYQDFVTLSPERKHIPTPTFIISYEAIVADAKSRNKTFLDILKNSIKNYSKRN